MVVPFHSTEPLALQTKERRSREKNSLTLPLAHNADANAIDIGSASSLNEHTVGRSGTCCVAKIDDPQIGSH